MGTLRDLFAYQEVRQETRLRLIGAALLLFYCETFGDWDNSHAATLSTYGSWNLNVVPTWIMERLGGPIFMGVFPTHLYFRVLYFCGLLGLFLLFREECFLSVLLLAFLFVNKAYYYLSDLRLAADFHHIHLILTLLFLVSRSKLFFFRMGLAACYLALGLAKLYPSWLQGEYFNSILGKVPFMPETAWVLTGLCLSWVIWEFIGPLLWFSSSKILRLLPVGVFGVAHAYQIVVAGPAYPSLMLPVLLSAFWNPEGPIQKGYRFSRRHLPSWFFLGGVLLGGLWHLLIPGDVRLTGEGRLLGLALSDANRAAGCRVVLEKGDKRMAFEVEWLWRYPTLLEDGTPVPGREVRYKGEVYRRGKLVQRLPRGIPVQDGPLVVWNPDFFTSLPYDALEPYVFYFYGREICRAYKPDRLSIEFHQQLDGHLERVRLLDIPDFCRLNPTYRPFRHNDWIRLPGSDSHPSYRWW